LSLITSTFVALIVTVDIKKRISTKYVRSELFQNPASQGDMKRGEI